MTLAALYQLFVDCGTVTTDSRHCPEGSLFIALKGASFNGNAFAKGALEAGCAFALIDEAAYAVEGDSRYILVGDCLHTMQQLANYHRRQLGTRVIGITGTNGKTTTKELIAAVLRQSHRVLATEGNLNNHIGVPITLLRLRPEDEIAVIEMGANHPGEIQFLCEIAEPDFGIITNVGKAHLEGFGSFEGVIRTKGELYDFLRTRPGTKVFIHNDDTCLMEIAQGLNVVTYGTVDGCDINGRVTDNSPFLSFEWKAGKEEALHRVSTQLIGVYNFPNALAAVTIGHFFGVDHRLIDRALEAYAPQNNRSQLQKTADNTLIIDAYNANPTSMMAALQNFREIAAPHKMLLLGDMRELGAESLAEHARIVEYIRTTDAFERVCLVGTEFGKLHAFPTYADVQELTAALQADKPRGYTILIKGSNGIRLSSVIPYL